MDAGKMTKARQESTLGEGLAVGCIAVGVTSFTANKMTVENAFMTAWRQWPAARTFRSIQATLARNDLIRIMHKSAGRRGVIVGAWTSDREHHPHLLADWTVNEAAELLKEGCGIDLELWSRLATDFVDALGETNVRRSS